MSIFFLIIGLLVSLAGLVGCVLPVIPGPPLSFAALIILQCVKEPFSWVFLTIMGVTAAVVTVLDYVLPALGAKKFGGSKWGISGSALGMLIGIFVFPPWGMIIGAFAGAVIGELSAGKKKEEAIKAGG
jgi:uncharacterized protein YqgC (DUF456 family)